MSLRVSYKISKGTQKGINCALMYWFIICVGTEGVWLHKGIYTYPTAFSALAQTLIINQLDSQSDSYSQRRLPCCVHQMEGQANVHDRKVRATSLRNFPTEHKRPNKEWPSSHRAQFDLFPYFLCSWSTKNIHSEKVSILEVCMELLLSQHCSRKSVSPFYCPITIGYLSTRPFRKKESEIHGGPFFPSSMHLSRTLHCKWLLPPKMLLNVAEAL